VPSSNASSQKGSSQVSNGSSHRPADPSADLASALAHLDQIRSAIKVFHAARGRQNTQFAAARMFELVGLPSEFPGKQSAD
jgi:hypothetical protein